MEEIAAAKKINASCGGRLLRVTLLAPNIGAAILDGRQPAKMTLALLMVPLAVEWREQRSVHLLLQQHPMFTFDVTAPDCGIVLSGRNQMPTTSKSVHPRKARRLSVITAVAGPVAFMHPDDVGKLFVPGSKRVGRQLQPNYATQGDGVDSVKVLMATDTVITFESFRPRGAVDTAHQHPDHHSVVYQKQGRTRMRIGEQTFIVEAGDSYFHPMGVVHQHEALEDTIRIETKIYPGGGAVAAWNKLVGAPVLTRRRRPEASLLRSE